MRDRDEATTYSWYAIACLTVFAAGMSLVMWQVHEHRETLLSVEYRLAVAIAELQRNTVEHNTLVAEARVAIVQGRDAARRTERLTVAAMAREGWTDEEITAALNGLAPHPEDVP